MLSFIFAMSQKGKLTLSIEEEYKAKLEQIALDFDCTYGDRPNISALLKRLADGELRIDYAADDTNRAAILGAIALIQEGLPKLMRLL